MTVQEIWLVRHGESMGNVAATRAEVDGLEIIPLEVRDADVVLSPTGEEQAAAFGEWLRARPAPADIAWVSPYVRARQTLALALEGDDPAFRVIVDERLRDRELGILDLLTWAGVMRLHPEEAARRRHLGKYYHRPPGGESWADVALRLRSFLGDAFARSDGTMLVVAHDAVVMLIVALLLPLEETALMEFAAANTVLNASVTRLVAREDGWELVAFSDVAHLQREGAPVTVHPGSPDVQPQ